MPKLLVAIVVVAAGTWAGAAEAGLADGVVLKKILKAPAERGNLLRADRWRAFGEGFRREGEALVCDNGADRTARRGASQTVVLNQKRPEPIVAAAWSKAEGVGGGGGGDYSLYLDLVYTDGTPLWGQVAPFAGGTHDWQRRQAVVMPAKPVRSLTVHLLLRRRTGKAWFRGAQLHVIRPPAGACLFDGAPVAVTARPDEGFQLRDVAAGSDFVRIEREALGVRIKAATTKRDGATFVDAELTDTTGRDRAVTLLHAMRVEGERLRWLADPRRAVVAEPGREYVTAARFRVGANGQLSRWPFAAVAAGRRGAAVGIDMSRPAFYRVGYNTTAGELYVAYDVGLTKERPSAKLRFCRFSFDPKWGFRSALARYYGLFPDHFRCRTPRQGVWMPFAKISGVKGWEDFGFRFKEGNNETKWDDEHDIITFRYTEPMTWWMRMPKGMPRTYEAALAHARRLAERKGDVRAKAFFASGFHDERGRFTAQMRDTPWCDGAVWSMNSAPGVAGEHTDFKNKWAAQRERLYGAKAAGKLDGEYVDSSECYVTAELDFRREHFAAASTPLTFSLGSRRPGVFKLLAVFEYVRGIERDVHGMGKLMMANSTPSRICWLAPLLDVMGTETNWNRSGRWTPMPHAELLYRRAICRGKPFCFLMNTPFEKFSRELVEKYMKRCLAYGMFPGFFSHNASQGHYFTRPELYERDRALFKKYVPLCRLVAEAGWEPITRARADVARVYVERFGERHFTVFNDGAKRQVMTVTVDGPMPAGGRELVGGAAVKWTPTDSSDPPGAKTTLTLDAEDVAVLDLGGRRK